MFLFVRYWLNQFITLLHYCAINAICSKHLLKTTFDPERRGQSKSQNGLGLAYSFTVNSDSSQLNFFPLASHTDSIQYQQSLEHGGEWTTWNRAGTVASCFFIRLTNVFLGRACLVTAAANNKNIFSSDLSQLLTSLFFIQDTEKIEEIRFRFKNEYIQGTLAAS